jgi:uncharacterized membrane protein (UPF0127 family)
MLPTGARNPGPWRRRVVAGWLAGLVVVAGCSAAEPDGAAAPAPSGLESIWVSLGGETFTLEVASDPAARHRGLSGRGRIPDNEGMLFVLPDDQPFAMVMRDCPEPIDVAFLDATGRVVAVHEMQPEPPRAPDETPMHYERRLPVYPSVLPVRFAIETAGGRLRAVGLAPGDRVGLDVAALTASAR